MSAGLRIGHAWYQQPRKPLPGWLFCVMFWVVVPPAIVAVMLWAICLQRVELMKRWLETQGYRMCWRPGRFSRWWARLFYRYYCPYPILDDPSARTCVKSGCCGCDNRGRLEAEGDVA